IHLPARMEYHNERLCPACGKSFATIPGRNMHLSSARSCKWYRKGKMADLGVDMQWEGGDISVEERDQNYVVPEPTEDDEDLEEAMENLQEDFFHFVPSQP
ncbi:hypothetical protein B0H21DRAFT_678600, partial [Amylocystis lapponica]